MDQEAKPQPSIECWPQPHRLLQDLLQLDEGFQHRGLIALEDGRVIIYCDHNVLHPGLFHLKDPCTAKTQECCGNGPAIPDRRRQSSPASLEVWDSLHATPRTSVRGPCRPEEAGAARANGTPMRCYGPSCAKAVSCNLHPVNSRLLCVQH